MTKTFKNLFLSSLVAGLFVAGCGPTFDPASLIESTRVVGARIEVQGAPDRASPQPGETASVTWLVTSPEATPPLGWTFAVCAPGAGDNAPACLAAPLGRVDGVTSPPRISIPVPALEILNGAASLTVVGGICAGVDSTPAFDPGSGLAACPDGGRGTTVSLDMPLQLGDDANHNPLADHAFTLDGAPWPAAAGDPCAEGPRVAAGSKGHVIGDTTAGSDRESYTAVLGDPPAPALTRTRERLQISRFTTAGRLKSQFSFVEATDENATTIVDVGWDAPPAAELASSGAAVTFTFVVRDDRGGADWTTRTLCVTP